MWTLVSCTSGAAMQAPPSRRSPPSTNPDILYFVDCIIQQTRMDEQQPAQRAEQIPATRQQQPQQMHDPEEPLSPMSDFQPTPAKPREWTTINGSNFIKALRCGLSTTLISIYEQNPFCIQFRQASHYMSSHSSKGQQHGSTSFSNITHSPDGILAEIHFESVIYDCVEIAAGMFLASNKGMPPRLYSLSGPQPLHLGSITSKKHNSELYLAPIELSTHASRPGYAVGGGRRFLCLYSLQRMAAETMVRGFDRANVSAVQMVSGDVVAVGAFEGGLGLVDLRQGGRDNKIEMRPHVDAVMSIVSSHHNPYLFASCARKDNYTYIWDIRNYTSNPNETKFVAQLEVERQGNQRVGMCWGQRAQQLYLGSESGEILRWCGFGTVQTESSPNVGRIRVGSQKSTVNDVAYFGSSGQLFFSVGKRSYEKLDDGSEDDEVIQQNPQNLLGFLNAVQ